MFCKMLEDDRRRAGWSMGQVAWRLGVSVREYRELEAGSRFSTSETWHLICERMDSLGASPARGRSRGSSFKAPLPKRGQVAPRLPSECCPWEEPANRAGDVGMPLCLDLGRRLPASCSRSLSGRKPTGLALRARSPRLAGPTLPLASQRAGSAGAPYSGGSRSRPEPSPTPTGPPASFGLVVSRDCLRLASLPAIGARGIRPRQPS